MKQPGVETLQPHQNIIVVDIEQNQDGVKKEGVDSQLDPIIIKSLHDFII